MKNKTFKDKFQNPDYKEGFVDGMLEGWDIELEYIIKNLKELKKELSGKDGLKNLNKRLREIY